MKKRKIFLISLLAALLAITAIGSSAFFNAEDTAHNVITSGRVNIAVIETMLDGTKLTHFPAEGISGVMPGAAVSKIVQVRNTGDAEAWIRVRVGTTAKSAAQEPLEPDFVHFDTESDWLDGGDGYYYYHEAVSAGDETTPLLREVRFDPDMSNDYQNCTVYIAVDAQAVQTANNAVPAGGSVWDVAGWPDAEGGN